MKEIDRAKKEEFERKTLIESLEKMPARVVATAYLYAMNYELYGEDVTKKWQTAVQNTASLQRAYLDGRRDEAQRQAGYPVIQPVPREALNRLLITHEQAVDYLQSTGWMQEHDRQMMLDGARKLNSLPEIIYCKDCRKHNKKVGFDENFHTVWKEDACPLVSWRGKAQGHEFDYQFCAFADKRKERYDEI